MKARERKAGSEGRTKYNNINDLKIRQINKLNSSNK